jgi:hypothetical protein
MLFSDVSKRINISATGFLSNIHCHQAYVDKTDLICTLCSSYNFKFLTRPRRFGKSTIVETLEELFKHGVKPYDGHDSYFKGLKIEKLWTDTTYKVLRIDFSRFEKSLISTADGLKSSLNKMIGNFAKCNEFDLIKT